MSSRHGIGNKINELNNNNKDFQIEELNSKIKELKEENKYLKHKCDRESELVVELEREMTKIIEENQDLQCAGIDFNKLASVTNLSTFIFP